MTNGSAHVVELLHGSIALHVIPEASDVPRMLSSCVSNETDAPLDILRVIRCPDCPVVVVDGRVVGPLPLTVVSGIAQANPDGRCDAHQTGLGEVCNLKQNENAKELTLVHPKRPYSLQGYEWTQLSPQCACTLPPHRRTG